MSLFTFLSFLLFGASSADPVFSTNTMAVTHGQLLGAALPCVSVSALHFTDKTSYFAVKDNMAKSENSTTEDLAQTSNFTIKQTVPVGQEFNVVQYIPAEMMNAYRLGKTDIHFVYPNGVPVPDTVIKLRNARFAFNHYVGDRSDCSRDFCLVHQNGSIFVAQDHVNFLVEELNNGQNISYLYPKTNSTIGGIFDLAFDVLGNLAGDVIGKLVGGSSGLLQNEPLSNAMDLLHAIVTGPQATLGIGWPSAKVVKNEVGVRVGMALECKDTTEAFWIQTQDSTDGPLLYATSGVDLTLMPNYPGQRFLISDQITINGAFGNDVGYSRFTWRDSYADPDLFEVMALLSDGVVLQLKREPVNNELKFQFGTVPVSDPANLCRDHNGTTFYEDVYVHWSTTQQIAFDQ